MKKVSLAILLLVAIYYIVQLATPKPELPRDVVKSLDSLQTLTNQLVQSQNRYDSLMGEYKTVVSELDTKIVNIKGKTTVIREYYHDKGQVVQRYTPSQLDSFFKQRYKY